MQQELQTTLTKLTTKVIEDHGFATWQQQHQRTLTRLHTVFNELQQQSPLNLAKVTVALTELARL